jgi:predicted RecB family nuclease
MPTKITREVLDAYLLCKTKAHLKLAGQVGTVSDYELLLTANRAEARRQAIEKILEKHADEQVVRDIPLTIAALRAGPSFILDATLEDDMYSLRFDGLKRVDEPSKLGAFHYVPMLFYEGRAPKREPRFLLELYGLLLTNIQGRMPAYGELWLGNGTGTTRYHLSPDVRKAERLVRELKQLLSAEAAPKLTLNDHCWVCEYQQPCNAKAVETDDISLLRGIGDKEIRKLNRKGIFTISQLSCIFRLRKRGKRVRRQQQPHYFALQAAAIRDKKIYVLRPPPLPTSPVSIYFDIEGDAERQFVYLIGLLIDDGKSTSQHSLWIDDKQEEYLNYQKMLEIVSRYDNYSVYHYGSYETSFLKRMKNYDPQDSRTEKLIAQSHNVLSLIYASIYFPLYSNGLKAIGNYLGYTWSDPEASGIKSIVLRNSWERKPEDSLRQQLVAYNSDDCKALQYVVVFLRELLRREEEPESQQRNVRGCLVGRAEDINAVKSRPEFCRARFAVPDFAAINACAWFDYQREKIFVRTSGALRKACSKAKRSQRKRKQRVNATIYIIARKCHKCNGHSIVRYRDRVHTKLAFDLKVLESGIRRQVIACRTVLHHCTDCGSSFLPLRYKRRQKFFHSLKSWAIYQHIVHRCSFEHIETMIRECFGIHADHVEIYDFKELLSIYYKRAYQQILEGILAGENLHADETHINFQNGKGTVWVLANMENVLYVYRPTRDAGWLQSLLHGYKGVLISDFFTGYDAINCEQQKCLIHLIRDMNGDLLQNPFDDEFRSLVSLFGSLLRPIVKTIDRYGLKRRHLHKHEADVQRFFSDLNGVTFSSELATDYWRRLVKYREKLFTFLRFDGVPWNNNNAEHAVKAFAYYRVQADGKMTEAGLRDYIILLSLYQTCRYRSISFLRFLLSQKTSLDDFEDLGRIKSRKPSLEVYPSEFLYTPRKIRARRIAHSLFPNA